MKVKKLLKETSNTTVFRRLFRKYTANKEGLCERCKRHSGCNAHFNKNRSWKNFRKTQYKNFS